VKRLSVGLIAAAALAACSAVPAPPLTAAPSTTPAVEPSQAAPTAAPTAAPVVTARSAIEIECSAVSPDDATVSDSTGLVKLCVGGQIDIVTNDHPQIFNLPGDPTSVTVGAPMSVCFGRAILSLSIDGAGQFVGSMVERGGLPNCAAPTSTRPVMRTVTVHFDAPTDAATFTINGWRLTDEPPLPPLSKSASDGNGDFALKLAAGQTDYPANEPIADIQATLAYAGAQNSIDVTGGAQLIESWQLEQLDGPFDQLGAEPAPCREYTIQRAQPVAANFAKSGAYSHRDPLAPYWTAYFADPDLRLPPGTWRISVGSAFSLDGCGGHWMNLHASIVIATH
jgi:hypothetical protein